MPDIPQLAFPPRMVNGQLATVEQGSVADAAGQVHLLCLTPQGWLTSEPDFGLRNQAHLAGGADVAEINRQIASYVPDAEVAITEDPSALDEGLSIVGVRISQGT